MSETEEIVVVASSDVAGLRLDQALARIEQNEPELTLDHIIAG